MLVRQLDFVGLTVWWGTTVRSYSLLRDNCKILQFFQSTDSFFWQLSMAHWQLSHWQLSDLTVVRSDSCPIWQLSALTVVRSDSCPILQMSDLTANIWQLSPNRHLGQGGVGRAAAHFDWLVGEGEGGVKEVHLSCRCVVFIKILSTICS